ncbi:GlxA family transcriptional regulator [Jannaschia aquimarina]|uniref:CdhR_4 protein n=1 Tax=Jannaschia aquimarina TaxID=935700 RepID=A0A0D1EQB2_9RHOB|nr:GlxA family transcriptional regulator [Jannaschia aquimarina]KIT17795.1 HTH-type transcriptional regulator CdhR [Jannaschia aquimarina]SNT14145.1 transcriptional regulator, AraC family with amidase-like domain [Jannaschia aquimarina]
MESEGPRHFVFVLLDRFSLISFAGAVDVLRLANHMAERPLYRWTLVGDGGETVQCSAGLEMRLAGDLPETARDDTIVLVSGIEVREITSKRLMSWLRREARRGASVAGLCTASHVMAEAGLLDGKRATIHWENHDSMIEAFPEVELTKSIFTIDGKQMTSAGGTSSVDLFLKLLANDQGEEFASLVADQLIYSSIRTDQDSQRLSIPTRIGVRHPRLSSVIKRMEENIEEPISPASLARDVGMSTRQLERLFRRYLNRSPKRYYMELRLGKARNLLMQTDMSIINVALACGFTSPSHFSKCYRAQYGTTPYRERGTQAAREVREV